jgi:serine protease Do
MIDRNGNAQRKRRRVVLLSSAAGLALALLIAGPGGYLPHAMPGWTLAAQAAASTPAPAGFADLVAKVKPAVISVRVKIDEPQSAFQDEEDQPAENGNGNIPMEPGSPMERFFHQYGFGQPHGFRRHHQIAGEGSGFFISADGYAVTNDHVVDHAKSVQVTTNDGTLYTAKVIGADQKMG